MMVLEEGKAIILCFFYLLVQHPFRFIRILQLLFKDRASSSSNSRVGRSKSRQSFSNIRSTPGKFETTLIILGESNGFLILILRLLYHIIGCLLAGFYFLCYNDDGSSVFLREPGLHRHDHQYENELHSNSSNRSPNIETPLLNSEIRPSNVIESHSDGYGTPPVQVPGTKKGKKKKKKRQR